MYGALRPRSRADRAEAEDKKEGVGFLEETLMITRESQGSDSRIPRRLGYTDYFKALFLFVEVAQRHEP